MDKNSGVVILTSGTRGDVQPYLALAQALQKRGWAATIATHAAFQELVQAAQIPFRDLGANPNDLLNRPGAMPLTFSGKPWQSLRASLSFLRQAKPFYREMLHNAWQACQGAGLVVVGLPTLWGVSIAEALGVPASVCPLQPLTRTSAYPSALQPFSASWGRCYNQLSHLVAEQMLWQAWRGEINAWRRRTLQLPELPLAGPFGAYYRQGVPFIYGFSEAVAPRPADWPSGHRMAGYWFLPLPEEWRPPGALLRFLETAPKPVYIGFGSMQQPERTLEVIRQAVQRTGVQAVVGVGRLADRLESTGELFFLDEAPHAWLFQHTRAAVHHGGAGTTGASLRAGLPTAIVPVGIDQFFWGARVAALGAGPPAIAQRNLTGERLATMLQALTEDQVMRARAARLGALLSQEDGAGRAVEWIEKVIEGASTNSPAA